MTTLCQPPRAVIEKPKLKVPPLSCDAHAHVLGPPSKYPYVANRSYTPPDALPSDFLRMRCATRSGSGYSKPSTTPCWSAR